MTMGFICVQDQSETKKVMRDRYVSDFSDSTLPSPTPTVSGCGENSFSSFAGDACYSFQCKIVSHQSCELLSDFFSSAPATNWALAESNCQNLLEGSHLASITDQYEFAYVTYQAQAMTQMNNNQQYQQFWIGLNDRNVYTFLF